MIKTKVEIMNWDCPFTLDIDTVSLTQREIIVFVLDIPGYADYLLASAEGFGFSSMFFLVL